MLTLTREELAWAAGFFDGEGCCCFYTQRGRKFLLLSIAQANDNEHENKPAAVLVRFHNAVGKLGNLSKVSRKLDNVGPRRKQWVFTTGRFEHTQAIIAMLWYWLGDIKKEQFIKARNEVINQPKPMTPQEKGRKRWKKCLH